MLKQYSVIATTQIYITDIILNEENEVSSKLKIAYLL